MSNATKDHKWYAVRTDTRENRRNSETQVHQWIERENFAPFCVKNFIIAYLTGAKIVLIDDVSIIQSFYRILERIDVIVAIRFVPHKCIEAP